MAATRRRVGERLQQRRAAHERPDLLPGARPGQPARRRPGGDARRVGLLHLPGDLLQPAGVVGDHRIAPVGQAGETVLVRRQHLLHRQRPHLLQGVVALLGVDGDDRGDPRQHMVPDSSRARSRSRKQRWPGECPGVHTVRSRTPAATPGRTTARAAPARRAAAPCPATPVLHRALLVPGNDLGAGVYYGRSAAFRPPSPTGAFAQAITRGVTSGPTPLQRRSLLGGETHAAPARRHEDAAPLTAGRGNRPARPRLPASGPGHPIGSPPDARGPRR